MNKSLKCWITVNGKTFEGIIGGPMIRTKTIPIPNVGKHLIQFKVYISTFVSNDYEGGSLSGVTISGCDDEKLNGEYNLYLEENDPVSIQNSPMDGIKQIHISVCKSSEIEHSDIIHRQ